MIFDELRAIQLRYGYLPEAELEALSRRTQTPLYQIHSVASFYPHFHLTPPAKAEVHVCADMSCRLNGACDLRAKLARRFGGARAEDVQIKDVSCLGRCDQAPSVAINDEIFAGVRPDKAEALVRRAMRGEELHAEFVREGRVACASDPIRRCGEVWSSTAPDSDERTLEEGHPEFAALRDEAKDPGTIKLNRSIHLKAIRRGPNGPTVQLECGDCHRPAAANGVWPYADAGYVNSSVTYKDDTVLLPVTTASLAPRDARDGHEYMEAPKFASACAGCHLLTFDKQFDAGAPHDKPEVVHAFLVKKFSEYITAHPGELREMQEPDRALTGKPQLPLTQSLTSAQWVNEHTKVSEELLWKKTCVQCHVLSGAQLQGTRIARWNAASSRYGVRIASAEIMPTALESAFPEVLPARITARWLPHAKFDHDAHRGFACVGCRAKALTSTETSNVLVPGIENCRKCHALGPDHAESRCFECHTYHDWSKRKEVKPTFTLPALLAGGR